MIFSLFININLIFDLHILKSSDRSLHQNHNNMKLKLTMLVVFSLMTTALFSQGANPTETDSIKKALGAITRDLGALKRIKFSGYVQPQFQVADSAGQSSVAGGNFAPGLDNRFMVRRGRLKVGYRSAPNKRGITTSQYTVQLDITERGIGMKDANVRVSDPWHGAVSLTAGVFNNPFGFEVAYSSSLRETPEYGRMSQTLFPNENEVGAMITIQGPKNSKWNWIKFNAGLFNGNGSPGSGANVSDFDSKKDFSTRIAIERDALNKKLKYAAGVSYYKGGFRIDSVKVYAYGADMDGIKGFTIDPSMTASGAKSVIADRGFTNREYVGGDVQLTYESKIGSTTLRGEMITGEQPGLSASSRSPNSNTAITKDIYSRNFNGAFFYFIQSIGKSPFEVVFKYDWYDPNTDVQGDDLGKTVSGTDFKMTSETDVRYDTYGFGLLYHFDSNVKIMGYYDVVKNETSANLSGFTRDIKDNVFTLRVQLEF
jgi:phosphate-selective porin